MTLMDGDERRFVEVQAEWLAITGSSTPDVKRFAAVKAQADAIVDAGLWTSGPRDMLSILGRQRDELTHSRLIAWLLVPTNRHGLGRRFLTGFLDRLWPGEGLLRSGPVFAATEVTAADIDDTATTREARVDIVLRGEGLTVLVENKLDAGEGTDQCERLYWSWAAEPGEMRWVFLTPTGRDPVTATSETARSAWRTMSYATLRDLVATALEGSDTNPSAGRPTAVQYLATLEAVVPR